MADEKNNRAALARLARIFRHFAGETGDAEFQKKFRDTAEELERLSQEDRDPSAKDGK